VDCKLSAWMEWGACSQASQRTRARYLTSLPNYCGKKCANKVISETKACEFASKEYRFCAWGEWSSFSSCPSTCTQTRKRRSRTLGTKLKADKADYLFSFLAERQTACFGTQFDSAACNMTSCKPLCTPVDCKLDQWSKWSVPMGFGLCGRTRAILKPNNDCGKPCGVSLLTETKTCPLGILPIDCRISAWSDWSFCENPEASRLRMRHIDRDPRNGGINCTGALKETQSCFQSLKPVPCSFTDWSKWDSCNTMGSVFIGKGGGACGDGLTQRTRRIKETSKAGGAPCSDMLSEIKTCQGTPCKWEGTTDCKWAEWSKWSECKANLQNYRTRSFKAATNNGKPCGGSGYEIKGCSLPTTDCELSDWTAWTKCSSGCLGITSRSRHLSGHKNFGKACAASTLEETEHCNELVSCPNENCVFGQWGGWKKQVSCGSAGQETRHREVKTLRKVDGFGCDDKTTETRAATDLARCPRLDCEWNDWHEWEDCSKTCGVGQKHRTRNLLQATIGPGARACSVSNMRETERCKKAECKAADCVDGQWDAWGKWEACSATCGAGVTWRRRVIKSEANYCGKQVDGSSQEVASCSRNDQCPKDVDCVFGGWNAWTDCSKTCDGTKSRDRNIKTRGASNGKACSGTKKETAACNPSKTASGCPVTGKPIDCKLKDWSAWTTCPVTCGGSSSQRERSRSVEIEALNGGKTCDPVLYQTGPCVDRVAKPCVDKFKPLDCKWFGWSKWGACDKCGGLMYRYRQVKVHAQYGGANCTGNASQDMKTCDRSCFDNVHCAWSAWGAWSNCDVSCKMQECTGHSCGKRTRKRQLVVTKQAASTLYEDSQSAADVEGQVQELYRRAQTADSRRWQEVSAAFVLGCLCFLLGFGVLSRVSRPAAAVDAQERELQVMHESSNSLTPRRQALI